MARTLGSTIIDAFEVNTSRRCFYRYGEYGEDYPLIQTTDKFFEIPIDGDVFEIPTFALKSLMDRVNAPGELPSVITAKLHTDNCTAGYKKAERNLVEILRESFVQSKLIRVDAECGEEKVPYYGTCGAIFNKDFKPIAMCSWFIEKFFSELGVQRYRFLQPILRIDPAAFVHGADSIERLVAKKLINYCLEAPKHPPYQWNRGVCFIADEDDYPVKVVIEESPFNIRCVDKPSISTTNQQLLQIAIDHIDEVVQ